MSGILMYLLESYNDMELDPHDIKTDTYRSAANGPMSKAERTAKLTHIPTGLTVEFGDFRSPESNKQMALLLLKIKIKNDGK